MVTAHKLTLYKLAALLIYIIISLIVTYPAIVHLRTSYIGNGADPELFMWFIKWVQYAVEHFRNPLISKHILFPGGVNLMWNSSVILPAFILSPLTKFFGAIFSYNVIVIGALCLSAFAAYIATLRFVNSHSASFFSGLIYGFSPYMIAQSMGHPHVTLAFIPPFLVWLGYDILIPHNIGYRKSGILLGILLFCQLLLGEELLASEAIIFAVALGVAGVLGRKELKLKYGYIVKVFLTGIPVFFVLSLPFLYVQFAGPARPQGLLQPQDVFVTDLLNLIVPGPFQLIKNGMTSGIVSNFTGNASEWGGYLGLPFLFIIIYTAVKWYKDNRVRFLAYTLLITIILSFGPHIHFGGHRTGITTPWFLFGQLPLLEHLLPGRFALYGFLFSGILIAIFLENMKKRPGSHRIAAYALFGAGVLSMVPVFPFRPYPLQDPPRPAFFASSNIRKEMPENSTVFIVPVSQGAEGTAMLWQVTSDLWFRMPEGFAINQYGFGPMPFLFTNSIVSIQKSGKFPPMDSGIQAETYGYLRYYKIQYIVVGPTKNEQAIISFLNSMLGEEPIWTGGVYLWKLGSLESTHGYFISGDKFNTYYKEMDWIGKEIEITTYDTIVHVQVSGKWLHNGKPIDITVSVREAPSGHTISEYHYRVNTSATIALTVPPNSTMRIIAAHTWVPDRYIHNGDHRNLSVLFKVEGVQSGNTK